MISAIRSVLHGAVDWEGGRKERIKEEINKADLSVMIESDKAKENAVMIESDEKEESAE